MKICSKTHQITPFKKMFSGKHAPEPPSKKRLATPSVAIKTLRDMQLAQRPKKLCPPWQIPHTPQDYYYRNLFEEMRL